MATDLTSAIEAGPGMVLNGVPWDAYLDFRANPENTHLRMTYHDGALYLMSPEYRHEQGGQSIALLIRGVARGLGLEVLGIGATTLRKGRRRRRPEGAQAGRRKALGSAKEPDVASYLGENERTMRDKTTLDLAVDPPPDLAIEVDNKADSAVALPVYARLGVPEVWRFDVGSQEVWFGRREGRTYRPIDRSLCLPMLTPSRVVEALEARRERKLGEIGWSRWIEAWAPSLPSS